jgi:hypothetical protein
MNTYGGMPMYVTADWGFTPKKKTIMKTVSTMMKRLLDSDTQKLVKAGFLNGDLNVTDEGRKELINFLFLQHKADLVKVADEKIAEAEKENK